jgi:hypothetical protein
VARSWRLSSSKNSLGWVMKADAGLNGLAVLALELMTLQTLSSTVSR